MKEEEKDNRIKNRESWLKIIVVVVFSMLIAYKLAISDLNFDFTNFDFSDLLSLILALFAIGLSVTFYFKATDTSNQFYDNTYKFTKDISTILGRIEAGFGERLRHLDEGYTGLSEKIVGAAGKKNIEETKEEIEKEKENLKREVAARKDMINSLIEKAQLQEGEKEKIKKDLLEKEKEIARKNRELTYLSEKLEINENKIESSIHPIIKHTLSKIFEDMEEPRRILKYPISLVSRKFGFQNIDLTAREVAYLRKYSIIEEDGSLTVHGVKILRDMVREISE